MVATMTTSVKSVTDLRPGMENVEVIVQVVSTNVVVNKPKTATLGPLRIAENLVGDATGVIVLQTRGIQVDQVQPGKVMHLHNAKVEFFKGTMRLTVDTRKDVGTGKIEDVTETHKVKANEHVNMSHLEFDEFVVGPKEAQAAAEAAGEGAGEEAAEA